MEQKQAIINEIVQLEWDMFSAVQSLEPNPSCQQDRGSFEIMRRSQFSPWPVDLLSGYLAFAAAAQDGGRNIITEKYAYMMEYTYPDEYARFQDTLPAVSPEAKELIEECIGYHLRWKQELDAKYPSIAAFGRKRDSAEDTKDSTSVETYLRGELMTYSLELLEAYTLFLSELDSQGGNYPALVMIETARNLGFPSLDEMDRYAGSRLGTD